MSDMIINDSVPVDKKWSELIRYNIFIMKLVEFVMSMLLMLLPFVLTDVGVMHCLAVAPTLVLSVMFIVLYLVDQVQDLAEQMYIMLQIGLNITAIVSVILVVAFLLNIIPHVVAPVDVLSCLVAGPTLMISLLIMVLYIVDQVQYEAEFYYITIETIVTLIATVNLFLVGKITGAIYGLFYVDLLIAFSLDMYYMQKERGFTY